MTCTYRRPAVDGFPRTAPCGLQDYYRGLCWVHSVPKYGLVKPTHPRVPKAIRFSTEPLRAFVQRLAREQGMTSDEYLGAKSPLRRNLLREHLGIIAVDRSCAEIGAHPTDVYGLDFYRGLEGVEESVQTLRVRHPETSGTNPSTSSNSLEGVAS